MNIDPSRRAVARAATVLRRRAWSRAGAIAVIVRSGTPRRVLSASGRIALLVIGSALISLSVAVTLWNGLGPGPLDVFIGAVSARTGLPLAVAVWATVGSLIGVAWLMGRRPGIGTVASPLLIGPMMQVALSTLDALGTPSSLAIRLALQCVAIAGIGLGAGALIVSGLGAGSGELLAGAASDRAHRPESLIRPVLELSWIVLGVALGGPAGIGTVLVAVFIAPAVSRGYLVVDRLVGRSKQGFESTHGAIIQRELAAMTRELDLAGHRAAN